MKRPSKRILKSIIVCLFLLALLCGCANEAQISTTPNVTPTAIPTTAIPVVSTSPSPTLAEAKARDYEPCSRCNPPR